MAIDGKTILFAAVFGIGWQNAQAGHYYVFSLSPHEARAFDLDSIQRHAEKTRISSLHIVDDKTHPTDNRTYGTTIQAFDCRAKSYQTEFEGENRYDGRVITNRPLPMAPFTSIGTMLGDKSTLAVICGRLAPDPKRVVVAEPRNIASALIQLIESAP